MSGPPRVRPLNVSDSDRRPILGPAGNKARSADTLKPSSKPQKKVERSQGIEAEEKQSPAAAASPRLQSPRCGRASSILRQSEFSLSASCSSDASSDSSQSRASTGRAVRWTSTTVRRRQCGMKMEKIETRGYDGGELASSDASVGLKRCAWVTQNADPCYVAFHDEEWGVPIHDDRKLFELLSLSCALAEITWPTILCKRKIFREVFLDFDPVAVSKLNEKKFAVPGSCASSLLSEIKLRSIIENARQVCKVTGEFGTFDKYIWNFINHKPIVSRFRYPRQVPVKTSKADLISKDLVRRGFRGVGPTVVYAFMQAAGMMNDHLIGCFRFQECMPRPDEGGEKNDGGCKPKADGEKVAVDE